MIYNEDVEMAS